MGNVIKFPGGTKPGPYFCGAPMKGYEKVLPPRPSPTSYSAEARPSHAKSHEATIPNADHDDGEGI